RGGAVGRGGAACRCGSMGLGGAAGRCAGSAGLGGTVAGRGDSMDRGVAAGRRGAVGRCEDSTRGWGAAGAGVSVRRDSAGLAPRDGCERVDGFARGALGAALGALKEPLRFAGTTPAPENLAGRDVAAIGGRPLFSLTRSCGLARAVASCRRCIDVTGMCRSRAALWSAALGCARTPPLPPL